MAVERQLTIPNALEHVPEACEFVVQAAESAGLDERSVYYCEMAVDEWCTNIIEHGYGVQDKQHAIDIHCQSKPQYLLITISDDSPPFDPNTLNDTDPSNMLEEREPGGLGWFFIRRIMDEVHYSFKEGRNTLTMLKRGIKMAQEPSAALIEAFFPSRALGNNIWVVMPGGRLDSVQGQKLEATLDDLFKAGHYGLIVEMSAVSYISSGGLKVLIAAWRTTQKQGSNLILAGLLPSVRKVFEIAGLDSLFVITASMEDAVATINGNASNGL
ncbi:MAG: anti-sigma factor antagonist [Chloroflexota bacterium]